LRDQKEKQLFKIRGALLAHADFDESLLTYAAIGHGVMGAPGTADDPDIIKFATLGGTARSNAAARADSWPKILEFLNENLKP
jgi:dienelactone hydrolase